MIKIGVFDSGIGGLSVAKAIERSLPGVEVVFRNDHEHMPYGDKPPAVVLGYVVPILQMLVDQGCSVIVIACNTVTTHHIATLRRRISVPLVGIEPMVKPAVQHTEIGIIAVCATPATLASKRYAWLKEAYAGETRVIEPDCSRWAYMIEHDAVNEAMIKRQVDAMCTAGVDVIVLGCTHYHWIEDLIRKLAAGRAIVIQPEEAVISRLKAVITKANERQS